MNKIAVACAFGLALSAISVSYAAEPAKTPEQDCKAQAEKKKIASDKMEEFIKTCVANKMKSEGKAAAAPAAAPATAPAQ